MNAKQEILSLLEIDDNADWGDVLKYHKHIRAILETHTLEPIDDRPFDPTLCGFFRESAVTTLVATKFQSNSGGGRT